MLAFTVPGEVRGKGRPRIVKRGRFHGMAADAKTANYENLVALACVEAMRHGGVQIHEGPLAVTMTARIVPAASASRRSREAMLASPGPTKKPDLDNIVKILDALNGIAFRDDSQIVHIAASKVYAETPGLDVTIRSAA